MNRLATLVIASMIAALAMIAPASAHKPSDSYLRLAVDHDGITGQWDIGLRDLDDAIGLDADDDGALTWGEVQAARVRIGEFAFARLAIGSNGTRCTLAPASLMIDNHSDGAYAVLPFTAACPAASQQLTVTYDLFADIDPQHRGLLRVTTADGVQSAILGPDRREAAFFASAVETSTGAVPAGTLGTFIHYLEEGVWHIWIGFDHILFLLALLLPAVLIRHNGGWHAESDFRAVLVRVLKIVTAFTIAHSITLSLATLGLVSLPARLIESLIAASVVLSALNNIVPMVRERLWMVAFGFGLVHGFGFANVLVDLGLPKADLALSLFGFNLGVELGQLAIVAVFLPLAFVWRSSWTYRRLAMPAGSLATCAIAGVWLVERAFGLAIISS